MQFVGWVERSDTHRAKQINQIGIALLHPSYGTVQTIDRRYSPERECRLGYIHAERDHQNQHGRFSLCTLPL